MAEKSHVGGIAYANGYLWIGDTVGTTGYISYYNYTQILEAINTAKNDSSITSIRMDYFDRGNVSLGSYVIGKVYGFSKSFIFK